MWLMGTNHINLVTYKGFDFYKKVNVSPKNKNKKRKKEKKKKRLFAQQIKRVLIKLLRAKRVKVWITYVHHLKHVDNHNNNLQVIH